MDANNKTGTARVSWEYFDLINDFMHAVPEIRPISLASSTHGFRLDKRNVEDIDTENVAPETLNTSHTRKRSRQNHEAFNEKLYQQKERHHRENIKMKKKFLVLFEKYLNK